MRQLVPVLAVITLCSCGDGLLTPSGSDAGPFPPLPSTPTFLDQRLSGCPTAAELAGVSEINVIWDPAARSGPLVCTEVEGSADLTRIQKRIYFALILMKEIRFSEPLPWTPQPLYEWFRDLVGGVRYRAGVSNSNCCGPDRIPNIFYDPDDDRPIDWPMVRSSIGLLIHEARHITVGPHPCQGRWDNRVSDYGGYGVSYTFYLFTGLHSDPGVIPPEYRENAEFVACRHRGANFCMEPRQSCK